MKSTSRDCLGDRMKGYEDVSRIYLIKRSPVIIRIDGRAFHTLTRGFVRPFDNIFMEVMQLTARYLCENIAGCRLAYVQSDEISLLLTDYTTLNTQPWFENNLQKLVSVAASMATLEFNRQFFKYTCDLSDDYTWHPCTMEKRWGIRDDKVFDAYSKARRIGATFDARAFVLPKEEVCNYFIWRQNDAVRNSIQMLAQANFSHKELQGLSCSKLQDKLMLEKEINWNDLPNEQKHGSCVAKEDGGADGSDANYSWTLYTGVTFTQNRNFVERYVYPKATEETTVENKVE